MKINNRIVMSKNISVKTEEPFCQLVGLPGVNNRDIDSYWINDTSNIKPTLEHGCACTAAGNNGAFNVWKDDSGIIRGELSRWRLTVEEKIFSGYSEAEKCVGGWLERIN